MRNSTMMRSIFSVHCPRDWMNYRMVTDGQSGLLVKLYLLRLSSTIYKMINEKCISWVNFCCKARKGIVLLIHQSY